MDERTGRAESSTPVFREHEIPQPTFSDQKQIALAVAIAIDKSQLLSGEATARTEVMEPEQAAGEIARLQQEWRARQQKGAA
jgi:hypothetical protein